MTEQATTTNTQHQELVTQFEAYIAENAKFTDKGVKAAAGRARKALNDVRKLAALRRKEITDTKNAMVSK